MARRSLAAVPDRPGRVVLYRRVSALMGRGGDDFHSPELQTAAMRRHIAGLGLREVDQVEDLDVSGRTFSRAGLDQIRAMVEAGRVDAIAVYDLSRLGRNAGEALRFIRWLREHRVEIISTVEKIDGTPEGQFILTQFLALAELYSNQVGRRWSEVIAHRARQGHHHAIPPLGYQRVDGELVEDPVVGPAVTRAFEAYAAGDPISRIALTIQRVRGKRTAVATVKRVLLNPVYLGQVVIWGRHRKVGAHATPAYVGPGRHSALTDEMTFERCRQRHLRDAKTVARHLDPSNPLVGLLHCAYCQGAMQFHRCPRPGGQVVDRFQCGIARTTKTCKGPGTPRLDEVLPAVLDEVRTWIGLLRSDPAAQAEATGRTARAGADVARLTRELAATKAAMGKLAAGWARGSVPDSAYEEAMAPLKAAEGELDDRLSQARAGAEQPAPREVASLAERILAAWPKMTVAERNRALKQVVRRVQIRRAERYREPVADRIKIDFW